MASIAPSKWSMSVHGEERWLLKVKLYVSHLYPILAIPTIALYALILCGCISKAPTIPTIYLAELRTQSPGTSIRLRFGYFGICSSNDNNAFRCTSSILASTASLASFFSTQSDLMTYAASLQRTVSYLTPSLASIFFLFGLLNLAALQLVKYKRKPSLLLTKSRVLDKHIHNLTISTRVLLWASMTVCLAAAQQTHTSMRVLEAATSSFLREANSRNLNVVRGNTIEIFLWTNFALSFVFNTIMHITTAATPTPPRSRKSTPLPFIKTDLPFSERRDQNMSRNESIRKITTATAQRLAAVGNHSNLSKQSLTTDGGGLLTPTTANSDFIAFNSPGLHPAPPLATLQRRPTNPHLTGNHKPSPLPSPNALLTVPNSKPSTPASPKIGQVTQSFYANQQPAHSQRTGPGARRIEVRAPERSQREIEFMPPLSPGLQGILKPGFVKRVSTAGSSVYSRPALSPKGEKGQWM